MKILEQGVLGGEDVTLLAWGDAYEPIENVGTGRTEELNVDTHDAGADYGIVVEDIYLVADGVCGAYCHSGVWGGGKNYFCGRLHQRLISMMAPAQIAC